MGNIEDEMIAQLRALRNLPSHDRERLIQKTAIGYGHGQAELKNLSIFATCGEVRKFGSYSYTEVPADVYYVGLFGKRNLGVVFNSEKKFIYSSRYYMSHLSAFVRNIDNALDWISRLNLDTCDVVDIGCNIVLMEKWFATYGHFKDEVYSAADFIYTNPREFRSRVLLDYPTDDRLDTEAYKFNSNFRLIDRIVFGRRSVNAYEFGDRILRMKNVSLVENGFNSEVFHSFPPNIVSRIRENISDFDEPAVSERVFLTRSKSYRDIANKIEVEDFFRSRGYWVVNPEEISYEKLVRVLGRASKVGMYYGSAMTNMVYASAGSEITIIKSQSYMQENIDLWRKVITAYEFKVRVVVPNNNVIAVTDIPV